jgi:hypothetical protein
VGGIVALNSTRTATSEGPRQMGKGRRAGLVLALATTMMATACSGLLQDAAVGTTAGILKRAQPALQMESDYELAARAIPGTLKTVEGFWNAKHEGELVEILAEGYCQYGTAFVEDEWEVAVFAKDFDRTMELNARATKMFTRCLNYALMMLPKKWSTDLFKDTDTVKTLISTAKLDARQRNGLMWAAYAMGSIINHNLNDVEVIAYLPTVKLLFEKLLAIDANTKPPTKVVVDKKTKAKKRVLDCSGNNANKCVYLALPHIAMGMLFSATGKELGGNAEEASKHFQKAIELTGGKMLLPRALMAYRVGKITQNKELFRTELLAVLAKNPAIWPEQRLANEVAHRRARRYLKLEKELFQ